MAPFPSLTKEWHSEAYPAIDPTRPELSAKGKVVAITGGGGSIGGATALAFAKAGAKGIAVIGRRLNLLEATKQSVEREVHGAKVIAVQGDLASSQSMRDAFDRVESELGLVDVLVANAGYLPDFDTLAKANADEWWMGFEINTKGAFNCIRALLPVAAERATVVDVSTGIVHLPALASASSYAASKLAGTKIYDMAAAENPTIDVVHIQPGVVHSDMNVKSGITATDDANLPGSFIVWAVSPEAEFLRGKYLWVNWDVEEMKERREELEQPDQLIITLNGWPFGQSGDSDALKFLDS